MCVCVCVCVCVRVRACVCVCVYETISLTASLDCVVSEDGFARNEVTRPRPSTSKIPSFTVSIYTLQTQGPRK